MLSPFIVVLWWPVFTCPCNPWNQPPTRYLRVCQWHKNRSGLYRTL